MAYACNADELCGWPWWPAVRRVLLVPWMTRASTRAAEVAVAHNTLTDEEESAGWELLFDGQSLEQWRGYGRDDLPETWVARDGEMMLQTEGGNMDGGDVVTIAEYHRLRARLRLQGRARAETAACSTAVQEVEGKGLWQVSAEYQVLDDPAYPESEDWDPRTHRTG